MKDKVALVTGGSSEGINFNIAKAFCEHGAKVSLSKTKLCLKFYCLLIRSFVLLV